MKEFNKEETIEDLIKTSLDRVKSLMETNTIVGEPIKTFEGGTIIPISKVSVGFVVGGGEYSTKAKIKNNMPMAGGSGCGMSVSPVGFVVIDDDSVRFIDIENKSAYQTVLNLINKLINKLGKNEKEEQNDQED